MEYDLPLPTSGMPLTAIIGSGGKTTLLADLARQYLRAGFPVITATTTKIGIPRPGSPLRTDLTIMTEDKGADEIAAEIARMLPSAFGRAVLLGQKQVETKIIGPSADFMDELHRRLRGDFPDLHILVEADGAARKPLKVHASWEPVIPASADLLILCAGLDALGQTWENAVHRWELGQKELGLPKNPGRLVEQDDLTELLALAASKIERSFRLEVLLNKADVAERTVLEHVPARISSRLALPVRCGSLKNSNYQDLPPCLKYANSPTA